MDAEPGVVEDDIVEHADRAQGQLVRQIHSVDAAGILDTAVVVNEVPVKLSVSRTVFGEIAEPSARIIVHDEVDILVSHGAVVRNASGTPVRRLRIRHHDLEVHKPRVRTDCQEDRPRPTTTINGHPFPRIGAYPNRVCSRTVDPACIVADVPARPHPDRITRLDRRRMVQGRL